MTREEILSLDTENVTKEIFENIFESENAKNREIFEMIKRYVRYSIGQKKLKGEEGEN